MHRLCEVLRPSSVQSYPSALRVRPGAKASGIFGPALLGLPAETPRVVPHSRVSRLVTFSRLGLQHGTPSILLSDVVLQSLPRCRTRDCSRLGQIGSWSWPANLPDPPNQVPARRHQTFTQHVRRQIMHSSPQAANGAKPRSALVMTTQLPKCLLLLRNCAFFNPLWLLCLAR